MLHHPSIPPTERHHMKKESELYTHRGQIEVPDGRGFRWTDGYSITVGGCVCYPWMTKKQARIEARAVGKIARFT